MLKISFLFFASIKMQPSKKKASLTSALRHEERSFEQINALYEAVLNHAGYAMIATDLEGIIILFNPAAERMLGYCAKELVGKTTPAIWHDSLEIQLRAKQFSKEFSQKIKPGFEVFVAKTRLGLPNQQEWTYIRKDGVRITVLLTITALYNPENKITGFLGIASDLTAQQQMQRDIQRAVEELDIAVELAHLGIWTWNPSTNALFWNERMYALYEQPLQLRDGGLTYDHWRMRLHPEDAKKTEASLAAAVKGTADYNIIFRLSLPSGEIRHIQGAAIVRRDEKGKALLVTGMNLDITTEVEFQKLLQLDKEKADAANQAKSAFVANMSHEIRTPMNAIIGLLQLLEKTPLNPNQIEYITQLQASSNGLLFLINDILDFSKIEANKLTLDLDLINIETLLRNMVPGLSINIGDKNLELIFNIPPNLPQCIIADGLRLQQIFLNLLTNAIKFTEQGEVIFSVVPALNKKNVMLEFSVRDTGIGIAADKIASIFESFTQAENSITRRYGGAGLGLAISKKLVHLMGGELQVKSKPGVGSNFYFRVQCSFCASKNLKKTLKLNRNLHHLSCLVVDDNRNARIIIANTLRSFGWSVEESASGKNALAKIKNNKAEHPFDIVYMDYRMPVLNGWETCERIRALYPNRAIKLLLMSNLYDNSCIAQYQNNQPNIIDGFLIKPMTPSSLFDTTADIFSDKNQKKSLTQLHNTQGRLNNLQILLIEDNLTNRVVARDLLASEGAHVSLCDNPLHALKKIAQAKSLYDLILMDIQMPEMDGYTLTIKIRKKYTKQALPIIAMSADISVENRKKAYSLGMNAYVSKPFHLEELVAEILRVTSLNSSTTQAEINVAEALSRFGGNQKIYEQALTLFIGDMHKMLTSLPSNLEKDKEKLTQLLHTMKGLAGTVGANKFAELVSASYQQLKNGSLTNKQWSKQQLALIVAGKKTILSVQSLIKQAIPEVKSSSSKSKILPLVKKLISYLETNNMKALDLYTQLKAKITTNPILDAAIESLDFKTAAAQCQILIKQLSKDA